MTSAAEPQPDELIERFQSGYGFELDAFQHQAIEALVAGRSTLVAAPTGAGKTVVGEFAAWHAVQRGHRCCYTTPIKALSNQKYTDFVARHGAGRVGLLTGDHAINGDAPIVVMTTEVLRNMLYEGRRFDDLAYVVLDEVHYLGDRARGAVWEEVIVQLPQSVQLAALSATVSNAEELGAWLAQVRSGCDVIITDQRPVPLELSYAVGDRILPMFATGSKASGRARDAQREAKARQAKAGRPNPEVLMLERRAGQSGRRSRRGRPQPSGVRLRPPRRSEITEALRGRDWLPAIYFLFSRAGCDDAVDQLMRDGLRLTSEAEAREIRRVIDERTADVPPDDLEVLGYGRWAEAAERGIAAHHAGVVPVFKETVEDLFAAGLLKMCFATETLALGINMPARTVVIERLEKWDGAQHTLLTPGQLTQLTGRAGRRGIDTVGHGVVLYQRDVDFPTVASLVSRRVEPLRSGFSPSYNMAVNLLRRHSRVQAEELLARSFAQHQLDAGVAQLEERIAQNREAIAGYRANLVSDRGDWDEYWALRRELSRAESGSARDRRTRRAEAVERTIAGLQPGDVVTTGSAGGDLGAVVSVATSRSGTPLATLVTDQRRVVRIGPREYDRPPLVLGRVELPDRGGPRQPAYRKELAQSVRTLLPAMAVPPPVRAVDAEPVQPEHIERLRAAVRDHPVHSDPAREEIERWAVRADELEVATATLERRVRQRTGSLVATFDRIVGLLTDLGYLDADRPTPAGERLARLYADTDLLLAECLRHGVLDDLDVADLAAVASAFVYEWRAREEPPLVLPSREVAERIEGALDRWEDLSTREEIARLPLTREPDPLFADTAWRWAAGGDLDDALGHGDLTAGDFVRSVKQVADLLRQVAQVVEAPLAATCPRAAGRLLRGVVMFDRL